MQKSQAIHIIKETFEGPFNKEQFVYFTKNLFNCIEDASFIYRGNYIPDAYVPYIRTLERVGKYQDSVGNKIDILIVHLKKETSLERARTMQRNFVAWYLNGSRGEILKDAAVVAFVSPDSQDWRFSLIKMEYNLVESKDGKTKVKQELTPARRWSFLVGENENSHTAQKRLLPVLQDDRNNPLLSQLEDAFNIEVVTKEFFEKYRGLFLRTKEVLDEMVKKDERIKNDFTKKGINTVNFAKKLLGQVVFLYFLQKKGWFGVERDAGWGTGPKNFLRLLFEKETAKSKNFFNDSLELLFYEALAVERTDDFYGKLNCKIPFLNGGLFEPINDYDWVHTDIFLPNELFSNEIKTKEGDIGTGILDVFDRYNFTVKEDEPLEKEVAVDPEMLGKVFENLLEVKDRKSKGTYYTPREIVHYMCQKSLINYLDSAINDSSKTFQELDKEQTQLFGNEVKAGQLNIVVEHQNLKIPEEDIRILVKYGETVVEHDGRVVNKGRETADYSFKLPQSVRSHAEEIDDALKNIRVCDPAVGSGAFLVGMMNEIVRARNALTPYLSLREADATKQSQSASVIVSEVKQSRIIYDFKRHVIQSCLYGVDIDPGAVEICKLRLWLSLVVDEEEFKTIKPLPNLDYKIVCGNSLLGVDKQDMFIDFKLNQLEQTKNKYFNETSPNKKQKYKKQIDELISQITNGHKDFDFEVYFSEIFHEKGGFDVVIANPPYIGESGNKDLFRKTKKGCLGQFYMGKMDYFYFFLHLALNIADANGEVAFITTNYFLTATGAHKLCADFKKRALIRRFINFNELRIFESAKGQHNIISLFRKGSGKEHAKTCITNRTGQASPELLNCILQWNDDESQYYEVAQKELYDGPGNYIRLNRGQVLVDRNKITINTILDKMANQGERLSKIANINQGVVSGCDYVSGRNINKLENKENIEKNDGIFVFDLKNPRDIETLESFTDEEKKLLRPFFKNSEINRYWCEKEPSKLLLYYEDQLAENSFPNINAHLRKFYGILSSRLKTYGESYHWTALHRAREEKIFLENKIVVPYRSTKNTFALNNQEWFCRSDCYVITEKTGECDLQYIIALLNSNLYYQWLYNRGKRKGETLELFQVPLSEIPIKCISKLEQEPFIDIVDKILAITSRKDYDSKGNSELNKKVHEYEKQIDQMVYKLYGLTKGEIEVVEGST